VKEEVVFCVNQAVAMDWTVNEGVECCERGSGVVVIFVAVALLYATTIFLSFSQQPSSAFGMISTAIFLFVFFSTAICWFH
jgi:hypothetical protein